MILPAKFYKRDTLEVARDLLGKKLVRLVDGRLISGIITETEAYHGYDDKASHAYKGKTKRTQVIFETFGYAYVYLCYGIHWMLNVTTAEADFPGAVLIRGVYLPESKLHLNGPGKLTKYFKIDKSLNFQPVSQKDAGIWIEDSDFKDFEVETSKRIGVQYAEEAKDWEWRFVIKQNSLE